MWSPAAHRARSRSSCGWRGSGLAHAARGDAGEDQGEPQRDRKTQRLSEGRRAEAQRIDRHEIVRIGDEGHAGMAHDPVDEQGGDGGGQDAEPDHAEIGDDGRAHDPRRRPECGEQDAHDAARETHAGGLLHRSVEGNAPRR